MKEPSVPIFLYTSFFPNFFTAKANENNLLIDSMGTFLFESPTE